MGASIDRRASAEVTDEGHDTAWHRRGLTLGLLAAGLIGPGLWSGAARAQATPSPSGPGLAASGPDVSPDSQRLLENLLTRMAVRTQLNGRAGFELVVDTGAGRTAIAQDVAEALNLPPGPPVLVHGVTSAEVVPTVRLARLSFGQRQFNDLIAPVFPRALLGADGLLGLDVLSRFELSFNLTRRTVHMVPSGSDVVTISRTFVTPSRLNRVSTTRARQGRFGQLILVSTRVDDVPVEAFVDSGAQYSIGNLALRRAIGGGPARGEIPRRVQVYGVTGQTLVAEPGQARQIQLSRQRLGPTPLLFADLHAFHALELIERPSLLIGADILYRFTRVSLDFGRSRMAFSGLKRRIDAAV